MTHDPQKSTDVIHRQKKSIVLTFVWQLFVSQVKISANVIEKPDSLLASRYLLFIFVEKMDSD